MPARKGQPNLTNDPGKRAGWEYRAVKGINRDAFTRGYYQAGETFFVMLRRAAKSRDMNTAAYLRRAVAAFAAKDLGIPFEEILKDSPAPSMSRGRDKETGTWTRTFDDGFDYGTWEVK